MSKRPARAATAEGTERFATRMAASRTALRSHYRKERGLTVSSTGIGTYLGEADDATDAGYRAAFKTSVRAGNNVIDMAATYRDGRSERVVGAALRTLFEAGDASRDEVVLATKGGYLLSTSRPAGAEGRAAPALDPADVVNGQHAVAPDFLEHQLRHSLANAGLDAVDVYFIHNPEVQLEARTRAEFLARMRAAFARLEEQAEAGRIGCYGVSTWRGLRADPKEGAYLSLAELVAVARDVAGEKHRFRALQLPLNLLMLEGLTLANQAGELPGPDGRWAKTPEALTLLDAAKRFGLGVWASASLLQGRLARRFPREFASVLPGLRTHAQRSLQFVRSTPGVTVALAGTSREAHAVENALVTRVPPLSPEFFLASFFGVS